MSKLTYGERHRPIGTWLTKTELEHFKAVARANHVSPAAYLRAMIIDVLAEEGITVPVPRHQLAADIFTFLRKDENVAR